MNLFILLFFLTQLESPLIFEASIRMVEGREATIEVFLNNPTDRMVEEVRFHVRICDLCSLEQKQITDFHYSNDLRGGYIDARQIPAKGFIKFPVKIRTPYGKKGRQVFQGWYECKACSKSARQTVRLIL